MYIGYIIDKRYALVTLLDLTCINVINVCESCQRARDVTRRYTHKLKPSRVSCSLSSRKDRCVGVSALERDDALEVNFG